MRGILVILLVALIVYAAIDCIMSDAAKVRSVPKAAWIAIIVLIPVIGALLWLVLGRPLAQAPRQQPGGQQPGGQQPGGQQARRRPTSPDDDPHFLNNLETQRRQQAKEAELRAKEAELRNREQRLNEDGKDSK
ncbi:PLD nuclease N-terminal domain-containing protein [Arthrobacter castelli]|uniref:PLD nuclease N-terminal domain-containing protein n=1 Tax=Arthrobacter castelli TaxID=271431 RepID=UPI00040071B8|nr:PLD nuclease N-terminal domain-containing protein [Arthrobacter castelli]